MIRFDNRELSLVRVGSLAISLVRKGGKILYEAVNSCFGKGYWINAKGWINTDGWRNNVK